MTYGLFSYGAAAYGWFMSLYDDGLTIEERIEAALFASVQALALADDPPLAWPNVAFTPPSPDEPYVRVQHLRNVNVRPFVKGSDPHLRQGILQLTAVSPLHAGPSPVTTLAASIAAQYPAGLDLFESGIKVRIQAAPTVTSAEKTDVSYSARVDVLYECFA